MTNVHHLPTSSTSKQDPLPISWIESLFDKMSMTYGRKFTDQWGGVDPKKLKEFWAAELAVMTRTELAQGYKALEARDWPPTLPEFKKMCRPPVDPMVAYYEAVAGVTARDRGETGQWTHPAIFWAAATMAHELKNNGYSAIKSQWEKALAEQMEKGQWQPIPAPVVALPAPGKTRSDRHQAERLLSQYREKVAANPKSGDHRRWIGRALERAKAKDETLPAITLWFAKEALNAKEEA